MSALAVYYGRTRCGTIEQVARGWQAITIDGEVLGPFPNKLDASRALPVPGETADRKAA